MQYVAVHVRLMVGLEEHALARQQVGANTPYGIAGADYHARERSSGPKGKFGLGSRVIV
jgi:hypothetical protein